MSANNRSGPTVSVLVVSYGTRDLTLACLRTLHETAQGVPFETIVVDNASPDDSADAIRNTFPDVDLVALDENIGFGRASNLAAARASGRFILLLNPDTEVSDGLLANLVEFSNAHPKAGLVGGRTLKPDGTLDPSSCWGAFTPWSVFCFATGLSAVFKRSRIFDPESLGDWPRDTVRRVGVVTGCLLLTPRAVWDELGGFDDRFFMYGEDFDLSARAIARGYEPMITPAATIVHVLGASTKVRADRLVLTSQARMTIIRERWQTARRSFGIVMYQVGIAIRAAGANLAGKLGRRSAAGPWAEVWRRRNEWTNGYPPFDARVMGLAIEREGS